MFSWLAWYFLHYLCVLILVKNNTLSMKLEGLYVSGCNTSFFQVVRLHPCSKGYVTWWNTGVGGRVRSRQSQPRDGWHDNDRCTCTGQNTSESSRALKKTRQVFSRNLSRETSSQNQGGALRERNGCKTILSHIYKSLVLPVVNGRQRAFQLLNRIY